MTDALPHMLLYLAGIHTKDYHAEYNILSPQYNEMRPRILKNTTDYDKTYSSFREASLTEAEVYIKIEDSFQGGCWTHRGELDQYKETLKAHKINH